MPTSRFFGEGQSVYVKRDLNGHEIEARGKVSKTQATSGNGQILTIQLDAGGEIRTHNDSDHLSW